MSRGGHGGGHGGGGRGGGGGGFHGGGGGRGGGFHGGGGRGGGGFHGGGGHGGHGMHPGSSVGPHRKFTPYYNYSVGPYGYGGYGGWYDDDYYDYPTTVEVADQTPYDWIGKRLIREGSAIQAGTDLATVILEHSMPDPHLIMKPGQIVPGYNSNRLLVYVDGGDIITAVRYG